jgi:hypothetical protein
MGEPLDVDVLLAWGRDWQRQLEAGPGSGFQIVIPMLLQYLTAANEGLAQLGQRKKRKQGGRPAGTGMGGQVAALITNGVPEDDAVRIIAEHHLKPPANVLDALRRYRAKLPQQTP